MDTYNLYFEFYITTLSQVRRLHDDLSNATVSSSLNDTQYEKLRLLRFWVDDLESILAYVESKLRVE